MSDGIDKKLWSTGYPLGQSNINPVLETDVPLIVLITDPDRAANKIWSDIITATPGRVQYQAFVSLFDLIPKTALLFLHKSVVLCPEMFRTRFVRLAHTCTMYLD